MNLSDFVLPKAFLSSLVHTLLLPLGKNIKMALASWTLQGIAIIINESRMLAPLSLCAGG